MDALVIRTGNGEQLGLMATEVARLANALRGDLLTRASDEYEGARAVWNGMIDRSPALIARCADADDVVAAVRFAADHNLLLSVRGGGHNIAGSAVCDDGLVIDLSLMRRIDVDPGARVVRVEPGCTLAELDAATQAHGLATPTGINSTTGIAGLTLGGGFGWLTRRYGLTVDNLRAVDIVTADGERLRASDAENADLFWAVRGGSGNFGVVTSFELALHPVGPEVLAGLIVHPLDDAVALLRAYREVAASAPDELTAWVVLRQAPPLPFLPTEWHGREVLVFALCYAGDPKEGEQAVAALREIGNPIAEAIGVQPFAGWQQAFDPLLTPGARNYWKSHDFTGLSDDLIDTLAVHAGRLPSPECEIFLGHLGGAANRRAADATAYPHRDAEFVLNAHGRWQSPADDASGIAWARDLSDACARHATGGVYVNFMTADEAERVRAAYGVNYDRLAELKARYDAGNLFRSNQNIRPAARVAH